MLLKEKAFPIVTVVMGACIEYYDYMLFAFMLNVPSFLGEFFPDSSNSASMLKGYTFFAVCALSRPFGAFVFGWIGDRVGRKQALFWALMLMAGSAFLMAGLPSYKTIGIWSMILLFVARTAQIISASGETNGAPIFLIEHFGITRAGLASGLAYFGTMGGSTLATLAAGFLAATGVSWRYAFAIGGTVGLFAIFIRLRLKEAKEFTQAKEDTTTEKVVQNFSSYIIVILISACASGTFYYSMMYLCGHWKNMVCWDQTLINSVASWNFYMLLLYSIVLLAVGFISDYISLFKIMFTGTLMLLVAIPTCLYSMSIAPMSYWTYALYAMISISLAVFAGPSHSFMYRFFPPKARYRSVSLCYSIATATVGAFTPTASHYLSTNYGPMYSVLWILPIIFSATISVRAAGKIWHRREMQDQCEC